MRREFIQQPELPPRPRTPMCNASSSMLASTLEAVNSTNMVGSTNDMYHTSRSINYTSRLSSQSFLGHGPSLSGSQEPITNIPNLRPPNQTTEMDFGILDPLQPSSQALHRPDCDERGALLFQSLDRILEQPMGINFPSAPAQASLMDERGVDDLEEAAALDVLAESLIFFDTVSPADAAQYLGTLPEMLLQDIPARAADLRSQGVSGETSSESNSAEQMLLLDEILENEYIPDLDAVTDQASMRSLFPGIQFLVSSPIS